MIQVLLIANAGFFVGSLIAALSINIGMLIAARAIQGIAGGGLVVLVNITIGDLFSPRYVEVYDDLAQFIDMCAGNEEHTTASSEVSGLLLHRLDLLLEERSPKKSHGDG
jgi:hypothetical protein